MGKGEDELGNQSSDEDTTFTEESSQKVEDKIKISVFNSDSYIAKENFYKIWQAFYKIDKSRERKYGGTGLGLSIVKGIIEKHNGNCGVEYKEYLGKKGMEFYFEV